LFVNALGGKMAESASNSYSINFLDLLTLIFVVAKIGGWLDWSWWWVFAPVIIESGIVVVCLIVYAIWRR
jgi:hypothetical protein